MVYRTAPAPTDREAVIALRPWGELQLLRGVLLWVIGAVPATIAGVLLTALFPVGAGQLSSAALMTALALSLLGATVLLISRVMRTGTVEVSVDRLRRMGLFSSRAVSWREITKVELSDATVPKLTIGAGDGRPLRLVPGDLHDPEGVLSWALERVRDDDIAEIDRRVREQGAPSSVLRSWLFHGAIGFGLCFAVAASIGRRNYDDDLQYAPGAVAPTDGAPPQGPAPGDLRTVR